MPHQAILNANHDRPQTCWFSCGCSPSPNSLTATMPPSTLARQSVKTSRVATLRRRTSVATAIKGEAEKLLGSRGAAGVVSAVENALQLEWPKGSGVACSSCRRLRSADGPTRGPRIPAGSCVAERERARGDRLPVLQSAADAGRRKLKGGVSRRCAAVLYPYGSVHSSPALTCVRCLWKPHFQSPCCRGPRG